MVFHFVVIWWHLSIRNYGGLLTEFVDFENEFLIF
jgi:hypothetical protein